MKIFRKEILYRFIIFIVAVFLCRVLLAMSILDHIHHMSEDFVNYMKAHNEQVYDSDVEIISHRIIPSSGIMMALDLTKWQEAQFVQDRKLYLDALYVRKIFNQKNVIESEETKKTFNDRFQKWKPVEGIDVN